jgi:glycosyltransferase involved in cell wall biosynthesis
MKIAMVDPSLFTLPYDTALCSALIARGCDVALYGRALRPLEVAAPDVAPRAFFYRWSERIRGKGPERLFHLLKGFEHAVDMARLPHMLRRIQPDVVHFQWLPLPAIDIHTVRRIRRHIGPVVLTVHDITPFNDSPSSTVQRIASKSVWHEFDHLVVHSESTRNQLVRQGLASDKISIIPHGILDMQPAANAEGRDGSKLVILLFGRIKGYKGVDLMIEALGRVPAALRSRCQVRIVGEPMIPIEPLAKRAEELGVADAVRWDLRYVSEAHMSEVFSQADVFAFPYREIDTSGVLMACLPYGKPIIASGIGAFGKLLKDGVHGRVVAPNDPEALAKALQEMLADPSKLQTYGRAVSALSSEIPSWDAIAGQTVSLYEGLLRAAARSTPASIRHRAEVTLLTGQNGR